MAFVLAEHVRRTREALGWTQTELVIAEGLTRDGILSPSGRDPARNRHRASSRGAWGKSAVGAILHNPRYTGRQVWNRQRRDEVLIDVEDVALGHETKMRWNDKSAWVWSEHQTHEPLISPEAFEAAQQRAANSLGARSERERVSARNRYVLAAEMDHPRQLSLRQDRVVGPLDDWLSQLFARERIEETCAVLAASQTEGEPPEIEAARRKLVDCDLRLGRYRAALENGADPSTVADWIREVKAERQAAERVLQASRARAPELTVNDLAALIERVGDVATVLGSANVPTKANFYASLGLELTYQPRS